MRLKMHQLGAAALLSLLLLSVLMTIVHAQLLYEAAPLNVSVPKPEPGVVLSANPWAVAGLQASLNDEGSEEVRKLELFLEKLERDVHTDRNSTAGSTCNVREQWATLGAAYLGRRGIKKVSDDCVTMRVLSVRRAPDLTTLHERFVDAADSFRILAARNWSLIEHIGAFEINSVAQRCLLRRQMAVRANNRWFALVEYTSKPLRGRGAYGVREVAAEHVGVESGSGRFSSLRMVINNETSKATTLSITNARPPAGGRLGQPELEANEAFADVSNRAGNDAEFVEENVVLSNVAILVLPLLMNLIPVSLFADINAAGMVVYCVFTDVLTAVPLAIKGVELISVSRRRYQSAAAYYAGNEGDVIAMAEIYIASCRSARGLDATGVVFIVLALTSMVLGVGLELFAKYWITRRKHLYGDSTPALLDQSGALGVAALMAHTNVTAVTRRVRTPHEYECVCMCHTRASLPHRRGVGTQDALGHDQAHSSMFDSAPYLPALSGRYWT